jgi:hypothetical protein
MQSAYKLPIITIYGNKGLRALREEGMIEQYCVVSQDSSPRQIDGIAVLPWKDFLRCLWMGEMI